MVSTANVRPATTGDATEITRIQRDTWRTAYAELLGEHGLAELDAADAARQWTAAIDHPETRVFVATEGEFTVGFSVSGPHRSRTRRTRRASCPRTPDGSR